MADGDAAPESPPDPNQFQPFEESDWFGRLNFRPRVGEEPSPWLASRLQGASWQAITGEPGAAPDVRDLKVRLEVEGRRGGWIIVGDTFTVDQANASTLARFFGGGRLWRVSLRHTYGGQRRTLPESVRTIDLTSDPTPPRPIPNDEQAPEPAAAAAPPQPFAAAAAAAAAAADPYALVLNAIDDPKARAMVACVLGVTDRDAHRQQDFYKAMIDTIRLNVQGGASAAPDLVRRIEADLERERAENRTLRETVDRQRQELFDLRLRVQLASLGAPGAAPSPALDAVMGVIKAAAPGLAQAIGSGLASKVDPNALMSLAQAAIAKLPAEQVAGALAAAGGVPS